MAHHDEIKSAVLLRRPDGKDWPRILEILKIVNYHRIGGSEMPTFPLSDCFVAEVDGHIAGVAGYRVLDRQTAKTTLMAVDPVYRNHGLGMALQRARMDYLRTRGIRHLYTNSDDEKVISWYCRHFGYRPTGDRVPKTEDFGLSDKTEWTTLVCDLDPHGTGDARE